MKFNIKREEFVEILSDFSVILRENSVKPVLSGIYIEAKGNTLTFCGTNMEVDLIRSVECKIEEEGKVVIKPSLILEYVKLLNIDYLEIKLLEDTLYVHSAEFSVMESELYPVIKKMNSKNIAKILPLKLKECLEKVKFCASQSTDNLAINVVRMNFMRESAEFVATDSFRMIYLKEDIKASEDKTFSIPVDSVNSLIKLMKYSQLEEVEIEYYENYLVFIWKNSYFTTKLIELQFPNYSAVMANSSFSKEMEFNNSEIKSSLRKVISISKSSSELKYGGAFDFKTKKLEIKASSGNAKISERVNMIKSGEDFKASLNAKYILEYVSMVEKNVVIKGNDSHSMFQLQEFGNANYLYIMMPLAVRD
ncbi:MAG: DNA polymerase III subunit beta [Fusobacteriaceae bacterium]